MTWWRSAIPTVATSAMPAIGSTGRCLRGRVVWTRGVAANAFMRAAAHWRRAPNEDWMVLLGSIGSPTAEPFAIGSGGLVKVERSGILYVYVNDLLCPICPTGIDQFYSNNRGKARITVSRYPDPGSESASD